MANFRFIKMAAAAILNFGNFEFLTVGTLKRAELRLHAKFLWNRSKRGWDMAIFQFFKMAAVRNLGFSEVGNFNFRSRTEAQYASSCQISRRSVVDFRFFKMSSAGILDVENFKFLTVGTLKRAELRLRAKFCRNRSNRGWHICMSYKKLK